MKQPRTFQDFLNGLPASSPIKRAHRDWHVLFNEITGGEPFFTPTANKEQMAELMTATTRLRTLLEEHSAYKFSVVKAYCGLLAADCKLIKAAA